MVFPEPADNLVGVTITQTMRGTPRWLSITMTDQIIGRSDMETVTLAYKADAERAGVKHYLAFCSSTYRIAGGRWVLIQHQQTPKQGS
jgi:hypothetical protein